MDASSPGGVAEETEIPFDLSERLIRIIRSPHFYKNGRLMPGAFRPQQGVDRVSIVRWSYRPRPESDLKRICHDVGNVGQNLYSGVAAFTVDDCTVAEIGLEDAQAAYPGHAHLVFPYIAEPQEPLRAAEFGELTRMANELLKRAVYVADPNAQSPDWTIESDLLPLD